MVVVDVLCNGLIVYDCCYGWCGFEVYIDLVSSVSIVDFDELLVSYSSILGMQLGVVMVVFLIEVIVYLVSYDGVMFDLVVVSWVCLYISDLWVGVIFKQVDSVFKWGDIVCFLCNDKGVWELVQVLKVQVVLVLVNFEDGVIQVLVGGFSFVWSKFNCVVMVVCQFGFSFKFYIYLVVFDCGFMLVLIVNDVLLVLFDLFKFGGLWMLVNDDGKFDGLICLCEVLVQLKNLVLVWLFDVIGVCYVCEYVICFGFLFDVLLFNFFMVFGIVLVFLMGMVCGYVVFVNGGYLVKFYFICEIDDCDGKLVYLVNFVCVCCLCQE